MARLLPESPNWQGVDGRWGDSMRLAHLPPPFASMPAHVRVPLLSTAPVASARNPRTVLAWVASSLLFQRGWPYRAHQAHATEYPATSHQKGDDAQSVADSGVEGRNALIVLSAVVLSPHQRGCRLPVGLPAQMLPAGQMGLSQDQTGRAE